jgi:hypothetical protein
MEKPSLHGHAGRNRLPEAAGVGRLCNITRA